MLFELSILSQAVGWKQHENRPISEMAGDSFSDSHSATVPKFLNPDPDPEIFQIWEFDSCSDSATIDPTGNLPLFYLRNDQADSCYCQN